MTSPAAEGLPASLSKREFRMVMAGLMMAMALAALDQNIVSTALPRIVSELGGLAHLSWVITAFMLTSTMTTPLYGKLSDMYGRKPLFYVAIGLFLLGSMLCGVAQTMGQLIAFRALQGLGAGGLMTLAQTTIGDVLAPRERPRYQGLFTGVFAVCSVAGPLLGGFLTSALSWRWIFYVNLPLGALALFLISIALKKGHRQVRHRLDYLGIVLLMTTTSAVMLLLSWGGVEFPWASPQALGLAVLSVALAAALFFQERRAPEPIIAIEMFKNRVFAVGAAVSGLSTLSLFGALIFMSLYFQLVVGVPPYKAGLLLTPQIGGLILTSILGGNIVSMTGRYKPFLVAGCATTATAMIAMAFFTSRDYGLLPVELCLAFVGAGMGLVMPIMTVAVQNSVDREKLGQATATISFTRSLGGSLGVSLFGGLMTMRLTQALTARIPGIDAKKLLDGGIDRIAQMTPQSRDLVVLAYHEAIGSVFLMASVVSAVAFFLVLLIEERPLRSRDKREPGEALMEA
jgi:EmrB/QacA subfamily drug resistance transporter